MEFYDNNNFKDDKEKYYGTHEDSDLKYFDEDNHSEKYKRWLSSIRCINCIKNKPVETIVFKQSLCISFNLKKKVKGRIMEYGFYDTSFASIGNGFVAVTYTDRKFTLVRVDNYLTKKYIPIGYFSTVVDSPNVIIMFQVNYTPLLNGGAKSFLSTAHVHKFSVDIHNVSRHCSIKQYIYSTDRAIPMKFNNIMIYMPIW